MTVWEAAKLPAEVGDSETTAVVKKSRLISVTVLADATKPKRDRVPSEYDDVLDNKENRVVSPKKVRFSSDDDNLSPTCSTVTKPDDDSNV